MQQGDLLGPLLFSLTVHPILKTLKSELRIFYLDDGTMGGKLEDVTGDLKTMEQMGGALGLVLNHSKSEVICADEHTRQSILAVSPHLQCTDQADACLRGSPIGGPAEHHQSAVLLETVIGANGRAAEAPPFP